MKIYAGKMFNVYSLELLENRVITVSPDSGLILDVKPYTQSEAATANFADPQTIDLRNTTVLPGFVDVHVHCEYYVVWQYSLVWSGLIAVLDCKSSCILTARSAGMTS